MFVTFFRGDQTVQCSLDDEAFTRFRVDFEGYRSTGLPLGGIYYDEGIEAEFFVSFQTMSVAEATDKPRARMRSSPVENNASGPSQG